MLKQEYDGSQDCNNKVYGKGNLLVVVCLSGGFIVINVVEQVTAS